MDKNALCIWSYYARVLLKLKLCQLFRWSGYKSLNLNSDDLFISINGCYLLKFISTKWNIFTVVLTSSHFVIFSSSACRSLFLAPLSASLRFRLASTFAFSVCRPLPHEISWTRVQNFFKFCMSIHNDTNSLNPSAHQNRRTFTMFFSLFSYFCSTVVVFLLVPDL